MNKVSVKTNIRKINEISAKMPKSINEAINFEGVDDDMMKDDMIDEPMSEPEDEKLHDEPSSDTGMDVMAFVDDIRKKSLKGMAQLADNPDDERYQLLKKIWQICDKKPEQQTAFSQPGQQKPQQPVHNSMM